MTRPAENTTDASDAMAEFYAPTSAWFRGAFAGPTSAQAGAWTAIRAGDHALVVAPTGSGKTLAAFLWAIDRLVRPRGAAPADAGPATGDRILYVSPLKALAADVERNLSSPLTGIRHAAARLGHEVRDVRIGVRTGDTSPAERRALTTRPPDILITTPESLYLMLTSGAREGLREIGTVIVDEIHAVAGTKRGAHLAVSLERLDELLPAPAQRVGLSATVNPTSTVAELLAGHRDAEDGGRRVRVVQPHVTKQIDVDVVLPVPDLTDLAGAVAGPAAEPDLSGAAAGPLRRPSIWPHVEERVVDLVAEHRSTIVFTNSRRSAERLTARLNEVWTERTAPGPDPALPDHGTLRPAEVMAQSGAAVGAEAVFARAHHGSMSRAERTFTESELKSGRLPAVVATSSLELGIDMGAVDLVVQIGSPPSVASGLQRIGRAGHQVGAVSRGVVFPTNRGDLVPAAVAAERMAAGQIERLALVRNPLDVLAQHVVAMVAVDDWAVADLAQVLRRAAPFASLGDGALRAVLDMLSGRYPSEQFGELRARITWDRTTDVVTARPGSMRLAVTSGGTIPDRGLYGVFLASGVPGSDAADEPSRPRGGKRVGELDEEMVYESRVGDTFTLGSSTWRIEDITPDRVLVSPAAGVPGRLPFWKGDAAGRPAELGQAIGAWTRELRRAEAPLERLAAAGLDAWAAQNLLAYLTEQEAATGAVPDDQTVVVERFRDEIGDWRIVIHSPYGARVHAPWALVLGARLRERYGTDVAAMHADDGIVLRLPDVLLDDSPDGQGQRWAYGNRGPDLDLDDLLIDPDQVSRAVREQLGSSVMFASRFREAAARALLLPRRSPDKRQPLWQQRQRSAQLLEVASGYDQFPIVLEAVRECLQDDFDVAALGALMRRIADGAVEVVHAAPTTPSPFAQSLLFSYTAQFLYDGDAPLAERRAAALTLDPTLLDELLGRTGEAQIADLLDPAAVTAVADELAGRTEGRLLRHAEDLVDLLRRVGPLPLTEIVARTRPEAHDDVPGWIESLTDQRRLVAVRLPGRDGPDGAQWVAVEDAGRVRDALGVALPPGLPAALTEPVADPLGDLLSRHARTHAPFAAADAAARFGVPVAVAHEVLERLARSGRLLAGRLLPESLGGGGNEYCDPEVMRQLRRRSLAALRREVEPVPQEALGVFLPRWQRLGDLRGTAGLLRAVEQLAGLPLPLSDLETRILPARVRDYSPAFLDDLTTTGQVLWAGHAALPGSRGAGDGLVSLHLAETDDLTLLPPRDVVDAGPLHVAVADALARGGAFFVSQIAATVREDLAHDDATEPPLVLSEAAVRAALWDLAWSGAVTNDSFAPLRALLHPGRRSAPRTAARPGRRGFGLRALAPRADATDGRWAALRPAAVEPTERLHALATVLLDRHGVLTRAVAPAEGVTREYPGVYRVLAALEQSGDVRRGYFVEHLGGSQFAIPGAVDALRDDARSGSRDALLLAATDPANPYGAALAWPDPTGGHRAGRKAGAVVVLVGGVLTWYLERGGRTVLTFTTDTDTLAAGADAIASAARAGTLGRMTVQRVDGIEVTTGAGVAAEALLTAGFGRTPRGLRVVERA